MSGAGKWFTLGLNVVMSVLQHQNVVFFCSELIYLGTVEMPCMLGALITQFINCEQDFCKAADIFKTTAIYSCKTINTTHLETMHQRKHLC